jgi:hypothetical protein
MFSERPSSLPNLSLEWTKACERWGPVVGGTSRFLHSEVRMADEIWDLVRGKGLLVALAIHDGHEVREEVGKLLSLGEEDRRCRGGHPFVPDERLAAPVQRQVCRVPTRTHRGRHALQHPCRWQAPDRARRQPRDRHPHPELDYLMPVDRIRPGRWIRRSWFPLSFGVSTQVQSYSA